MHIQYITLGFNIPIIYVCVLMQKRFIDLKKLHSYTEIVDQELKN